MKKINVNDKFELIQNGAHYEVYHVYGRENHIPNSEALICLKLTSRSFFQLGSQLLFTVPETKILEFFKPRIGK